MNIRTFIRQALHETLGQADKVYFKPGKLSQRVKDVILKITGGDAFTKIITDIYFFELNDNPDEIVHSDILNNKLLNKIALYYKQLKEYNKNVFPIKDFDINGNTNKTYQLVRSLEYRGKIIEQMKVMPSIALRNMKNDIRQERNYSELMRYNEQLEYFLSNLSLLDNRDEKMKKVIQSKMFKANITLKYLINFVEEKENLLGGAKYTKSSIKKIVKENEYDLEIVYESGNIIVVDVTSAEGIKEIGCNSLWCFTYGSAYESASKNWPEYSTNGHVYAIIDFSNTSNDPNFMHVLIKPLDYNSEANDYNGDEENHFKLYNMANEMLDNPLSFIENTVGLQNAPNVFHFGQEFTGPTSKWPYEDPNQLKLDLKEAIQKKLQEEINNSQLPGIISINNETFYHQTSEPQAQSILQNGFHVHMHDGQARFTHGIYFLNHPEGHFGETTLTANVSGNFIDFTNDEMGDAWLALKSSYNWNNYVDLTLAIQKDFPNADGLVFNNKYMCVVWYPEKCISDIQLT